MTKRHLIALLFVLMMVSNLSARSGGPTNLRKWYSYKKGSVSSFKTINLSRPPVIGNNIESDGSMMTLTEYYHEEKYQSNLGVYTVKSLTKGILLIESGANIYVRTSSSNRYRATLEPLGGYKTRIRFNRTSFIVNVKIKIITVDKSINTEITINDLYNSMKNESMFEVGTTQSMVVGIGQSSAPNRVTYRTLRTLKSDSLIHYAKRKGRTGYPFVLYCKDNPDVETKRDMYGNGVYQSTTYTTAKLESSIYNIIDNAYPTADITPLKHDTGYTLTASKITDGVGIGVSDYYWKIDGKDTKLRQETITTVKNNTSATFYIVDHLGNSKTYSYDVTIESNPPTLNVAPVPKFFNGQPVTLRANPIDNEGDIKNSYWILNGSNQPHNTENELKLTTGNVRVGSNTVQFYAKDYAGNEKTSDVYDITYDNVSPTIAAPVFNGYKFVNGVLNAVFTWSAGSDSGGSGLSSSNLYKDGSWVSSESVEYQIPHNGTSRYYTLVTRAYDEAGNQSNDAKSTLIFSFPEALGFDGSSFISNEIIPKITGGSISYPLELPVTFGLDKEFETIKNNNIGKSISYKLNVTIDGEKETKVLTIDDAADVTDEDDKKLYNYVIKGTSGGSLATKEVTFSIDTMYSTVVLFTKKLATKTLGKVGSKPVIGLKDSVFTRNSEPVITFNDAYATGGINLDGYGIVYKLLYKKPNSVGYLESSINHDPNSLEIQLLDRDGKSIFVEDGDYSLKVVSKYKDINNGSDNFSSNIITIRYDKSSPLKPVITTVGNKKLTKDNINFVINNITDVGIADISHLSVWTKIEGKDPTLPIIKGITTGSSSLSINDFSFPGVLANERKNVTVYVQSVDKAGNVSEVESVVIDVDKVIPVVTNIDYICTEDTITFKWDCFDQAGLQVNNGSWIVGTDNQFIINSLGLNQKEVISFKVRDNAGNESLVHSITGYTLDTPDSISASNISQEVINGKTYINISFGTDSNKWDRYLVEQIIGNSTRTVIGAYTNGKLVLKQEYSEKLEHNFKVNISNSGGIYNTKKEILLSYTPVNFKPVFLDKDSVKPDNRGYAGLDGVLEWPTATEYDTDDGLLKYKVTITPKDGETIVYDPVEPLIENKLQLSTLLGDKLENNREYSWFVTANDEYEDSETTNIKSFTVDNNKPVITVNNEKTDIHTNKLSFNIRDLDSGMKSVLFKVDNSEFTHYLADGDDYTLDLLKLASGTHSVEVIAEDNVGNLITKEVTISYDRHIPSITTEIKPELKASGSENLSSSRTFNISFNVLDDYSGIKKVYYGFSVENNSENILWIESIDDGRFINTQNREVPVTIPVTWNGVDGSSRYLFVKVVDESGLESTPQSVSNPIYIDSTAPVYENVSINGLVENNNKRYLLNLSDLEISPVFKDSEEILDVNDYKYLLLSESTEIVLKDFGTHLFNSVNLDEGKTYTVKIIARNRVNSEISKLCSSFIYDNELPFNGTVEFDNSRNYIAGDELNLGLTAEDSGSGIIYSYIKLGTRDGLADIGNKIVNTGWIKTGSVYKNSTYITLPNDLEDGNYFIESIFKDGAGRTTIGKKNFVVDNNSVLLTVNVAPFTAISNDNNAQWGFNRPELISEVSYRVSDDPTWKSTNYPDSGNIINFNNELTINTEYFVEVKIKTTDGSEYSTQSNKFIYDNTSPTDVLADKDSWPEYIRPGYLKVNWNVNDIESNISEIKHKVEILDGALWREYRGWIVEPQIVNSGERVFSNLDLKQSDKVRIKRLIRNGAGTTVERTSPVIIVDETIPGELTNIVSNGSFLKTTANPTLNWKNTETDNESGINYYWSFRKSLLDIDSIADWTPDNGTNTVTITTSEMVTKPQSGETWYLIVKGVNGVGLETFGHHTGITFDDDAPDLLDVSLIGDDAAAHIYYLTDQNNLVFNVEGFDFSNSTLEFTGDFGYYNNTGEYVLLTESKVFKGNTGKFLLTEDQIKLIEDSKKLIVFRADVTDAAGNMSLQGFSPGTLFDNTKPVVINQNFYISAGHLYSTWDGVAGETPIEKYKITLKLGSLDIPLTNSGYVNENRFNLDITTLDDGIYTMYIEAVSESGLLSEKAEISEIVIDNNAPEVTNISVPNFVYRTFKPEIALVEDGSGIVEYQYSVGTAAKPDLLTGGWVDVTDYIPDLFKPEINLFDFTTGYDLVTNGNTIYISFMAKDSAGKWSDIGKSRGFVLDKTLAENLTINLPERSKDKDKVISIDASGMDSISGIEKMELTLFKVTGGTDEKVALLTKDITGTELLKEYSVTDFTFATDNLELLDDTTYRVGLRLANGTGVYSEMAYSGNFLVDLTPPVITFTSDELVFNENMLPVNYSVSEDVEIILELVKGTNVRESLTDSLVTGSYNYIFDHKYTDEESAYGTYTLRATLTDLAGNKVTYSDSFDNNKNIRYNEPPRINFGPESFKTTPGQPYVITPVSITDNDDDDELLVYNWTFTTGGNSDISSSGLANPVVKFYHGDTLSTETTYLIEVTVTDNYGKSATKGHSVVVENTRAGQLYTDEYWRGVHNIDGDVLVPAGITLSVEPNAQVKVSGEYFIDVSGYLKALDSTTFTYGGSVSGFWGGISINEGGNGVINNSTISRALNGVSAVDGGSLEVTNSYLDNNVIGVHAFDSDPVITDSWIRYSVEYGVKEDGDSSPVLTGVTYTGNAINYYDSEATIDLGESR